MKTKKVVMLEFMNENNNWSWYGVYETLTPRQALISFAEEQGIDEKLTFNKEKITLYLENIEARAYYIDLIN